MQLLLSHPPSTAAASTGKLTHLCFSSHRWRLHSRHQVGPCPSRAQFLFSFAGSRAITSMATENPEAQTCTRTSNLSTGRKQALISLSDKQGLDFLGSGVQELGYTIVSTGGTAKSLEQAGISVIKVEEITSFPEMDGLIR